MRSTEFLEGMLGKFAGGSDEKQYTLLPWSWSKKDFCFLALNMENARWRKKWSNASRTRFNVDIHSSAREGNFGE